jgi:hypothetical protein
LIVLIDLGSSYIFGVKASTVELCSGYDLW